MKPLKSLAVASAVMAFAATARAECSGVHQAVQTAANETATGTVTANKRALNRLAANRLAANRRAINRLAANRLTTNQPGEGAASDIIAIEMPDGTRLSR